MKAADLPDSFPAASTALTVTVYSVSGVRPVSSSSKPSTSLSVFTFVSSTYTLYPATPTLSADAVQVIFAPVCVTSDAVTPAGTDGASLSFSSSAANVVNVAASDLADSFPAASTALTVTVYSVFAVSPVKSYSVTVTGEVFTLDSPRYTLYPATPTLSADAVQVIFAPVCVTSDAVTPAGTDGASVSCVFGVVNVAASDLSDSFSAASTAVTLTEYAVSSVRAVKSYSVVVISVSFTFASFKYTLYPTTPTLSVASLQVTLAVVVVTSVTATFPGAVGASVSAAFFVVNVYTAPSETLPAASTAFTVTLYSVPAVRFSSAYSVPVTSVSPFTGVSESFTYTLYPATPTLSVDAVQVTFAVVVVISVAVTSVGAVGASVSAAALST